MLAAALALLLPQAGRAAETSPPATADPSFAGLRNFASNDGAYLYRAVCQGCHMADARGAVAAAAYPPLADNPRLAAKLYPALMVANGRKGMPPLGADLNDEQIAAVVNYVRSHFGNRYTDTLSAAEVNAIRR